MDNTIPGTHGASTFHPQITVIYKAVPLLDTQESGAAHRQSGLSEVVQLVTVAELGTEPRSKHLTVLPCI